MRMTEKLEVVNRAGQREDVQVDKITERIRGLCYGLDMNFIDPPALTLKVVTGLYPGVTTVELDTLAAETAACLVTKHPDWATLAARIAVSNLHKETDEKFSVVAGKLFHASNPVTGRKTPAISESLYKIVMRHAETLDAAIDHKRDFDYSFFGFKTLERSYLLRVNKKVVERPQHLLMRVAVGIHGEDIDSVIETYDLLSERWFTHATPTLFNAGTNRPQLSSCFLVEMMEDSIEGIYKTATRCALISKSAGGIGLSVHNIRATGSEIVGTNGTSNGLVPMLQVYNATARYVDQGGNKRPGAIAIYLEPWHADVFAYIDLKKNTGATEFRARDLFYALWIPDLFMKRVESDSYWSLMCPNECPGLSDVYGEEFEALYTKYENENRYRKQISARKLWFHITDAQIETGMPYMLYKDSCNRKSNQRNLGTIKSSNLCTEIVEYTARDEVAVCNLASIALNRYVKFDSNDSPYFDFERLMHVSRVVTRNLNKIIDINYYPVKEAENSNMRHRPIGIGVQGLADAFILMRMPFDSPEARQLNKDIFEAIYLAACEESCNLAEKYGPYETYYKNGGCPASQGLLQFDLWGIDQSSLKWSSKWAAVKEKIARVGMRNSLLMAPMPTASTAQILGNNESIEPYTSNMYCRRVLSGEFQVVNPHLMRDLVKLNLWNEEVRMQMLRDYGSVQNIDEIPDSVKALYRTVWEIPQKSIIEMAADRGPFIDQSMSMNIHIAQPTRAKLTSMHFFGWKAGLKTGLYYLRTKPAANPIQFTLDKSKLKKTVSKEQGDVNESLDVDMKMDREQEVQACKLSNGPNCDMCSG